jgi:photosystem II stability/assembly factor-like uncharacterized protein
MKTTMISVLLWLMMATAINGQNQWEIVNEGIGTHLQSMDFINDSVGRGIYEGTIFKTGDGGRTWEMQKRLDDNFRDLYAVTESIVYAFGRDYIVKTTDEGSSWLDITPGEAGSFGSACFLNADTGIAVGDDRSDWHRFFRTFNGGESWDFRRVSQSDNYWISDIKFINDSAGYFLAGGRNTNDYYHIFKTADSFNRWSPLSLNNYLSLGCHFFIETIIISVMRDSAGAYIMKSYDHGLNWEYSEAMVLPKNGSYEFCFSGKFGFLLQTPGGILLKSTDWGDSWTLLNLSYPFSDVYTMDEKRGYFVGGEHGFHCNWGHILRTDDACETFDFLAPLTRWGTGKISSCLFISDYVGFSITEAWPSLLKTPDGGDSWNASTLIEEDGNICFINDSTAFATAPAYHLDFLGWQVFKTVNTRGEWEVFQPIAIVDREIGELNSLSFMDENTGWVVGVNNDREVESIIYKYAGPYGWSEIPPGTNLPLNQISFINHNIGWISGGYHHDEEYFPLFMRSDDGGSTWTQTSGLTT